MGQCVVFLFVAPIGMSPLVGLTIILMCLPWVVTIINQGSYILVFFLECFLPQAPYETPGHM